MEPIMEKNSSEDKNGARAELPAGVANIQMEGKNIEFLLDIPLNVSVEVGRSKILIKDLMQMREGYVIELDKLAGEPLDLYINSRLIARGEAVLVNDKFGLRLIDVVSPAERIEKLG
jgi:flagellar motor switch protein FliN/FliY